MKALVSFHCGDIAYVSSVSGDVFTIDSVDGQFPNLGQRLGWALVCALEDIAKGEECELVEGGFRRKRDEADTPTEKIAPAPYSAPNWTPVDTREPLPKKAPIRPLVQKKEPVMVEVEWKVTAAFSTVWLEGLVDGKFIGEESHTFWFSATPEKIAKILPKMKARVIKEYRASHQTEVNEKIVAGFGGKEQIQLDD